MILTYYAKNREKVLIRKKQYIAANRNLKEYIMVGKKKLVKLPSNTIATLHARFIIDESSKTGLRWVNSIINRPDCRGEEAGSKSKSMRYYTARVVINSVMYKIYVAQIIMMMATNKLIEPGLCVNHINRKTNDNRLINLEITTQSSNNINCSPRGSNYYKNVYRKSKKPNNRFQTQFTFLGKVYKTKSSKSEDYAFMLGWELITSGEVPLDYIKSQIDEWKDGTYLQRALAECEKQGIAVTPPKFKTLYEYIAFVENNAN